jgi:hypothetical protein
MSLWLVEIFEWYDGGGSNLTPFNSEKEALEFIDAKIDDNWELEEDTDAKKEWRYDTAGEGIRLHEFKLT